MPISLGARPEHGFDQPLGLLSDCHRRIEHFLAILQKVADQAAGQSLDDQQRRAVEVALEYFRSAAPRHTADEEQSLFPLLRACDDPAARQALAIVESLEHDHATADAAHAQVDSLFRRWIERGSIDGPRAQLLSRTLTGLRDMYRRHIDVEDRQLFPLAAKVLTPDQLARVGGEMARRRGLPPPPPAPSN